MGAQRTGKGFPGDLVLDAGALIAFDRGDQWIKGALRKALDLGARVFIPTSALAQVWRGGVRSASFARLLDASEVDSLSESRAKEVGVRLGHRAKRDIVDAHVVCCALECKAAVVTSDASDITALAAPDEWVATISV